MTGPWSHEWDGLQPVSVFVMAEQLTAAWPVDVGTAEVKQLADQWAATRAAAAVDVGRQPGPDDRAYVDCRCTLTPAAARAVWGNFY